MGRSGYRDDCENVGLWRATVERSIKGKRGQAFLREMAAALDAMLVKELVSDDIVQDNEHVCALGSVALARCMNVLELDVEDGDAVGTAFGISRAMACEIAFVNDDDFGVGNETPEKRWRRVRAWVDSQIMRAVK